MVKEHDRKCPCQSSLLYQECCEPFIKWEKIPTPEQLMRSRYTAFCLKNLSYIEKTMVGPAKKRYDKQHAEDRIGSVNWIGLKIVEAKNINEKLATVEFMATFQVDDHKEVLHEVSTFIKDKDRWYYSDGKFK